MFADYSCQAENKLCSCMLVNLVHTQHRAQPHSHIIITAHLNLGSTQSHYEGASLTVTQRHLEKIIVGHPDP